MGYLKQSTKMGTWKARKLVKGSRASRESGKKKGLVPPTWARYCARSGRAYKSEWYSRWCEVCNGDKIKWSKA
jgi:hypothetical protein